MAKLDDYTRWMVHSALPLWAQSGFDPRHARFRERLDLTGAPVQLPHRAMVQARQIYVFAAAAERGWHREGGPLAEAAMASLLRDFCDEDGKHASFAFSIDPSGAIVSSVRDTYAHAFVLFAIASLYTLNGDRRLLEISDKIVRFVDDCLTDPVHGGLFDAWPQPAPGKQQNPHMHLLEAYLFLDRAAPGRGYRERAARIVALFRQRLFDEDSGCLLEYFDADWSPTADAERRGVWEPGHHFEWVWLLDFYARVTGEPVEPWRSLLHDNALRHGWASGLILDQLDASSKQTLKTSSRLWPHTEAIKAATIWIDTDPAGARALAETAADALLGSFLDRPISGGWTDHLDAHGVPLTDFIPASSLYHLFLAATEASSRFGPFPPVAAEALA